MSAWDWCEGSSYLLQVVEAPDPLEALAVSKHLEEHVFVVRRLPVLVQQLILSRHTFCSGSGLGSRLKASSTLTRDYYL